MVRFTTREDLEKNFIKKLLGKTLAGDRCPHLMVDETGPYCGKDLRESERISMQRRGLCDKYALQLWCLDNKRYGKCVWYKGEPFE